jgi:hypothetical protein
MSHFDRECARALLMALHGSDCVSEHVNTDLGRWGARAEELVIRHWCWIGAVADALVQRQNLSGDEIAALRNTSRRRGTCFSRERG